MLTLLQRNMMMRFYSQSPFEKKESICLLHNVLQCYEGIRYLIGTSITAKEKLLLMY